MKERPARLQRLSGAASSLKLPVPIRECHRREAAQQDGKGGDLREGLGEGQGIGRGEQEIGAEGAANERDQEEQQAQSKGLPGLEGDGEHHRKVNQHEPGRLERAVQQVVRQAADSDRQDHHCPEEPAF